MLVRGVALKATSVLGDLLPHPVSLGVRGVDVVGPILASSALANSSRERARGMAVRWLVCVRCTVHRSAGFGPSSQGGAVIEEMDRIRSKAVDPSVAAVRVARQEV